MKPPSYVSHLDLESLEQRRGGSAAGNAAARPVDPQLVGLSCQYAFEVAEIDHYLADLFVVVAKTKHKIYCARPWITLMVDVFSGCVLGMWIGLSAPSRRSCAMVIRDCIRRHGRIANCLRVDNGSEFHSVFLDTLIAYLGITKEHRPPRDPKYASEVERSFKTLRTQFLDDQPGHLLNNARGRAVAAAFKGEAQAALDIAHFVEFAEDFVFNDFNGHPHANNVFAPMVLLEESIEAIGVAGIPVTLDAALMVATAVEAPSATYEISYADGIRVSGGRYRSAEIMAMLSRGTKRAEIRLEPYDDSYIYVFDRDREQWHVAQKRSAIANKTSTDVRPQFDSLLRAEGTLILNAVKQDRDRHYVQKRDEWKKVLQADGIEFLDLTETPPEEQSPPSTVEGNPPGSSRIRSIPPFVGFT